MDCRTARDHIASWLDGELSRGEVEQLEAHMEHCESCRAVADDLSQQGQVLELLRPLPLAEVADPAFWDRMHTRLSREVVRVQREGHPRERGLRAALTRRLSVPAPAALAYAAALLGALWWGWAHQERADQAEAGVQALAVALEREQRLAAAPAMPLRSQEYRTSVYTPHRGNF